MGIPGLFLKFGTMVWMWENGFVQGNNFFMKIRKLGFGMALVSNLPSGKQQETISGVNADTGVAGMTGGRRLLNQTIVMK